MHLKPYQGRFIQEEQPQRVMRAKMKLTSVLKDEYGERLHFSAVCKTGSYPEDGLDEDNTYAKFSPSGEVSIYVANPALFGQLTPGKKYYVDFAEASE